MKKLVIIIIFIIVITVILKSYWGHLNSPVDPKGEYQAFVISKGESSTSIAQRLEKDKIIRSAVVFKVDLRQSSDQTIPSGDFKISPSQSIPEIIKTFQSGTLDKWVTLLEGWRKEEMADKLHSEIGLDKDAYIKNAKEGYMFPDTYLFNPKSSVETVISTQENTFDQKYSDEVQSKVKKLGLTPAQGVILASIIEREGRSDKVRQQIASILLKRLNIGMGLNVDATLQYALGYSQEEKTWWRKNITKADKAIDSPYNTYLHAGLPPTPICNPSLSSLEAVSEADPSTPYLYYYVDSKGKIYYAKTLDEHNANVDNHP